MKSSCAFVVYLLSVIVEGAWWAATIQPIILGFGAVFTALNQDEKPLLDFDWNNLQIFKNDRDFLSDEDIAKVEPILEKDSWEADFKKEKREFE